MKAVQGAFVDIRKCCRLTLWPSALFLQRIAEVAAGAGAPVTNASGWKHFMQRLKLLRTGHIVNLLTWLAARCSLKDFACFQQNGKSWKRGGVKMSRFFSVGGDGFLQAEFILWGCVSPLQPPPLSQDRASGASQLNFHKLFFFKLEKWHYQFS